MRTVYATTKDTAYIEPNSLLEKYTWLIARPTTLVHILGAEGVAKGGRSKGKGRGSMKIVGQSSFIAAKGGNRKS